MRTCYEIEETDAYLAARELLLRRCGAWAEANGLVMSLPLAESPAGFAALQLGRAARLLDPGAGAPGAAGVDPGEGHGPRGDLLDAPETLRTLLRYLDAHGLRDPRGAAAEENESAIDAAAKEFADAIGDQERYGMAKTVAMSARDRGVDIGDPAALAAFLDDVQEGRVVLDEDLLGRVLERQLGRPHRVRSGNSPSFR